MDPLHTIVPVNENVLGVRIELKKSRFIHLQDLIIHHGSSVNAGTNFDQQAWIATFLEGLHPIHHARVEAAIANRNPDEMPIVKAVEAAYSRTEARYVSAAITKVAQQLQKHRDTNVSKIPTDLKQTADKARIRQLFSELPNELLEIIQEYTISDKTWVRLQTRKAVAQQRGLPADGLTGLCNVHMCHGQHPFTILKVSKRFYDIASKLVYGISVFAGEPETLSEFARMISLSSLQVIQRICIMIPRKDGSKIYPTTSSIELLKDWKQKGVQLSDCLLATAIPASERLYMELFRLHLFVHRLWMFGLITSAQARNVPIGSESCAANDHFISKVGTIKAENCPVDTEKHVLMIVYRILGQQRLSQGEFEPLVFQLLLITIRCADTGKFQRDQGARPLACDGIHS